MAIFPIDLRNVIVNIIFKPCQETLFPLSAGFVVNDQAVQSMIRNPQAAYRMNRKQGVRMPIHIAICDDETCERSYVKKLVDLWSQARGLRNSVMTYDSAEAFLFAFDKDKSIDILLLDIQMGGLNGISLAKQIREIDERMQIVFITGFPDFISAGFDVSALHYLIKPINQDKLCEILDRAVARLAVAPRTIFLSGGGETIALLADEILYAEVFSHNIELHTVKETIDLKISLNELVALLDQGFFRCHRSYIVNIKHIRRITRKAVILDHLCELPLSRSRYDAANQALIQNR